MARRTEMMGFAFMVIMITHCASIILAQDFQPGGTRKLLAKPETKNRCTTIPERFGCRCDDSKNSGQITVNCAQQNLTSFPTGMPKLTRKLYLNGNNIQAITARDFSGIDKLVNLNLDYNRITRIESDMFRRLPSLATLSLINNSISFIAPDAFSGLTSLAEVNLKGNPLQCDCHLRRFRDSIDKYNQKRTDQLFILNGFCEDKNKEFMSVGDNEFGPCDSGSSSEEVISCFTCQQESTNERCTLEQQQCRSQEICQSTLVARLGEIQLSKRCSNSTECQTAERANPESCVGGTRMVCNYCCSTNGCNSNDYEDRLESFSYNLTFRMEGSWEDRTDTQREMLTSRTTTFLKSSLRGLNASFHVEGVVYRSPNITTEVRLQATVLTAIDRNAMDMWNLVNSALIRSATSGPLQNLLVGRGTILLDSSDLCEPDMTTDENGRSFYWNLSMGRSEQDVPCPDDESEKAERKCKMTNDGVAFWDEPDYDDCTVMSDITRELAEIRSTPITDANLDILSSRLRNVSLRCSEYIDRDIGYTVDILLRLIDFGMERHEGRTISNCVTTLSNMFAVPFDNLVSAEKKSQAADRYLTAVDNFAGHVLLIGEIIKEVRPNLAIVISPLNTTQFDGLTIEAEHLSDNLPSSESVTIGGSSNTSSALRDSIVLPRSLFSNIEGGSQPPDSDRASFVIFQNDMFFKALETRHNSTGEDGTTPKTRDVSDKNASPVIRFPSAINSRVMSASIGNLTITNLREPVLITFRHQKQQGFTQPNCVFWDSLANGSAGAWSSDGCYVKETTNDSHTVCACSHLTNFALLMDIYASGSTIDEANAYALSVISYVGCAVSFFGLLLTIIIYSMFRKLRRDNPSKILLNLCVALAAVNITFVGGMYALGNPVACKVIAALLHYFLLASMMWMLVEAFYMYMALVLVFNTYFRRFMLKCMLIGWGIPLVIVAITLGVNTTDNYGSQTGGQICWLNQTAFYAAFLAPVGLILLLNFIAFGLVIRQITGLSSKKLNKSETSSTAQQLRGIVGVVILLGLTWVFAIFAIGRASIVFYYLFAIFNSLQGLFVFLFYCLLKKDAQRRLFCCLFSSSDVSSQKTSSRGTTHTSGQTQGRLKAAVNAVRAANYIGKRVKLPKSVQCRTKKSCRKGRPWSFPSDNTCDKTPIPVGNQQEVTRSCTLDTETPPPPYESIKNHVLY